MDLTVQKDGIEIRIMDGPYIEGDQPTVGAIRDYQELIQKLDELKGFAADKLLKKYNEHWLDEKNGKLDRIGFMLRLSNPAIQLYDELGAAAIYFEDGGLFAGHWIEISISEGRPMNAGIIG